MRVLAFEDRADIEALLRVGGVDLEAVEFQQNWTTDEAVEAIREFGPEVLLLDHYIPPTRGLEVLRRLLAAVSAGDVSRPGVIVGMSTLQSANRAMLAVGADLGIVKHEVATLDIWPRR